MSNEELAAAIQAGATERLGELWEQVSGLVTWKAHQIMTALDLRGSSCGVELEDLIQSGYLALVKAVETYEPAASAFSTWFMYYLQKAFAEATGYRTRKSQNDPLNNFLSLDAPLTDDANSDTIMEVVADPVGLRGQETVEEGIFRRELHEAVEAALLTVPEDCREILRLRYWGDMSLENIGEQRGVSKERIRQIENKGIRLLRQPRNACHLRPFYDFDFYCHTSLSSFHQTGMSIQERYLVIEEERKEREAQERKRRDEEWNRRMEENQKWLAEYRARQEALRREREELTSQLPPEEKAQL